MRAAPHDDPDTAAWVLVSHGPQPAPPQRAAQKPTGQQGFSGRALSPARCYFPVHIYLSTTLTL